jgi:Flp pilus assembly protein TadD
MSGAPRAMRMMSVLRRAATVVTGLALMGKPMLGAPAFAAQHEVLAEDLSQPEARATAQLDVLQGLVDAGLVAQALGVATDIRAAGVKSPRLDLLQARAMHAQGMTTQAAEMLRGVVKKQPRNEEAWSVLGLVLSDGKDLGGATAALEHAHRLAPRDAKVLNNLGYLLMAKGQTQRAVEMFSAAIVQDPSSARSRNNLGFALARLERDGDAMAAFGAAGPEADARYNMGVACELRGDTASALTNYQAALSASADHQPAAAALARLLHLGSS